MMEMPEGWKSLKEYEEEFLSDEYTHYGLGKTLKITCEFMKEMAEALELHDNCEANVTIRLVLKKFKEWK